MVGLAWTPPVWAALPQGNAVQDPAAILRDSLPMNQEDLRDLQHCSNTPVMICVPSAGVLLDVASSALSPC